MAGSVKTVDTDQFDVQLHTKKCPDNCNSLYCSFLITVKVDIAYMF